MRKSIIGNILPNIPWEDKPKDCIDVLWRYSGNPVLGWNPIPKAARIFNSAVAPFNDNFAGIFQLSKIIVLALVIIFSAIDLL